MENKEHFEKLLSFMQQQGFVWGPEPEIYGGLAGFYTYAPNGKLLKNHVEREIRKVFKRNDFMEVECPTVMQKEVWKASGHLDGFNDPIIEDDKGNSFRADKLIEEHFEANGIKEPVPVKVEDILDAIEKYDIKSPNGRGLKKDIKRHSLMMGTTVGMDQEAHNRPETATTTYLPFKRYDFFFRSKYPFGVFQIGQAYRNEISPRHHILRKREFTQAEAQMFVLPDEKNDFDKYKDVKELEMPFWTWKLQDSGKEPEMKKLSEVTGKEIGSEAYAWTLAMAYNLFVGLGIPEERIRVRQHGPDEKAFYADDAWDIEIETKSFGWTEVCGVHDRTDYDLNTHTEHSNETLETNQQGDKITPHILEIAFGTDRPTFCLMDLFYDYQEEDEGKTTFRIPYKLSPQTVAVFPLMRKDKLQEKANEVYMMLNDAYDTKYDETASIGKRYLRASQAGIPFCVTIDYDTLDDDTVTVRDRDSEDQIRVEISELKETVYRLYQGEKLSDVGDIL